MHSKIDTNFFFETENFHRTLTLLAHTHLHQAYIQRQQQQRTAEVKQQKKVKKKRRNSSRAPAKPYYLLFYIFCIKATHTRQRLAHPSHTEENYSHSFSGVLHILDAIVYARVSHWFSSTKTKERLRECVDRSDDYCIHTLFIGRRRRRRRSVCARERILHFIFRFCDGSKEQTQNCTVILKPEHTREAGKTKLSKAHTQFIC